MSQPKPPDASEKRQLFAHALPMFVFILLLGLSDALKRSQGTLWLTAPEFWIYPIQTFLCAGLLFYFWSTYRFHPLHRPWLASGIGLFVFLLWVAPQQILHFPARLVGFNPDILAANPGFFWATVLLRFLRLVLIVPLVEEIFWRGFLLRFLISEKFTAVPFGAFSWLSFSIVTLAFGLSHSMADWPAAFLTGALYNVVAYRTKSLTACVLAHGLTNLALGFWIMTTKQWGFW
ncbi:MAG: CAAX prenyl protease-related protein [Spartobacteria bacterium]